MRYRRRPLTVQAILITKENKHSIVALAMVGDTNDTEVIFYGNGVGVRKTDGTKLTAEMNGETYFVVGTQNEIYLCDKATFEESYTSMGGYNYLKSDTIIHATKYTGDNDSIISFVNAPEVLHFDDNDKPLVNTLEGIASVNKGDWVVRNIEGYYYPIPDNIFTEIYEEIQ